jgi:hypothetical protein
MTTETIIAELTKLLAIDRDALSRVLLFRHSANPEFRKMAITTQPGNASALGLLNTLLLRSGQPRLVAIVDDEGQIEGFALEKDTKRIRGA